MTASGPALPNSSSARSRRYDPERRERLIATTLEVIATDGVAGTSHREIARRADVPLGSMTYHFANMDELLSLAFTRFMEACTDRFDKRMHAAESPKQAQEALVQGIVQDYLATPGDMLIACELYAVAVRRPVLREVMQRWMESSQYSLRRHFDADDAKTIDAFIGGLIIYGSLSIEPMAENEIRAAIHSLTDPFIR